MATRIETLAPPGPLSRTWNMVLAGRPMMALVAVWLTTAGHTSNFREMEAARGWVSAQGYSLHSVFLFSIALTLMAGQALSRRFSAHDLVEGGLAALVAGSLVNGLMLHASMQIFVAGRILAGIGAGIVIFAGPRLLPPSWQVPSSWLGVIFPALGPPVIAAASMLYGWSSWEWGFLFEGFLALVGLTLLISMSDFPEAAPPSSSASLKYLPWLIVATAALWHILHWGQLEGWLESSEIAGTALVGVAALAVTLWLAWPQLDLLALRENWLRLLLIAYAGLVQYINVSDMGIYGGLMVNFSAWQRSLLVVSLSVGAAAALTFGRLVWGSASPGRPGALAGLLILAGGMFVARHRTLEWPFWDALNTVDLRWYAAPQMWELAPSRFLMGFGSALVLLSMNTFATSPVEREATVRPFLPVAQLFGGGIGIGLLVTVFLVAHQVHYSYSVDRGFIQPDELTDRHAQLSEEFTRIGNAEARRQADVFMYRAVRYQADNLIFATLYAGFFAASLALGAVTAAHFGWSRLAVRVGAANRQADAAPLAGKPAG